MGKILVTGGAGFVGSQVVQKLLDDNREVVILDHLKTKKGGLGYVNPNAELVKKDITDSSFYKDLDNHKFDGIYHLAAQACGEDSYSNPNGEDLMINSHGTWLVANYCKTRDINRLIYTSTNAVYGHACKDIVDEKSDIEPASIYGVSKYAGELFIKQLLRDSQTNYTIFRLTNIYGPGENLNYQKKGLVSILCSFPWKKEPVNFRGSLERYRDLLYINDAVEALVKSYDSEKTFNEVYILSSGEKTYFKDLLSKVLHHSGNDDDYPITFSEGTPGDMFGFHADISKIKRDLDWEPKTSVDEGLRKYFDWINKVPVTEDISPYHPFLVK